MFVITMSDILNLAQVLKLILLWLIMFLIIYAVYEGIEVIIRAIKRKLQK